MSRCSVIQLTAAVAVVTAMTAMLATAQQAPARGGSAGMIELGPDDKPAFPDPPAAIAAAEGAWIGRAGGVGGVAPNYDSWGMPFENDLLKDIIPYVAAHYSVYNDREHRALAGLSMGGGQTLNIGLAHVETFAWIGGFSSAPITKAPADLVPDPARLKRLKVLWLACGNKDGLIRVGGRSQVPQGERRPSRLAC